MAMTRTRNSLALAAVGLLCAASLTVRAFQTPAPAKPATTAQQPAAPGAPPVINTTPPPPVYSKLPGNIWPPVMKAGKTSPALTPEDEAKTFSLPPGYHAELVAAEPMVESPIVMN